MAASFFHVLLAAAVAGCSSAAADGAHGYWMNSPSLNGWREAVFRAGVPAQPAVLPPGVEPMMVGSSSPAAQMLVLEGMTHLLTFGDMRAFLKFDAALRLDPDCLMAHWGRCMSLMGAGPAFQEQRVHSMKRMKELALRPDCPEQERAYADALAVLLMDGPVKAQEAWETICSTWKRDPYAPLFYAMLLRDGFDGQGNPGEGQKEAVRVVEAVLKERPGSQAALFMRALLEEVAPSISPETVEIARRAVAANPFSASAHHLLGHCLFRTGDYEGASAAFKESENLCLAWEKAENVPPALDDAYFRSILYRAVSEFWSLGQKASAGSRYPASAMGGQDAACAPDAGPACHSPAGPCAQGFSGASSQGISGFEQRHDRRGHPIHGRMLRRKAGQNGCRGVRL